MSSFRVTFEGMNELRDALSKLPEDLTQQSRLVVQASAREASNETVLAYPVRRTNLSPGYKRKSPWFPPGILRGRVTVTDRSTNVSAVYQVKSAAPHASLFENGNEGRKRYNSKGQNRGAMPAAQTSERMIPKVVRIRARMYEQLKEIVRLAGFEVSET